MLTYGLYAHILRAKMPCTKPKSKHAESLLGKTEINSKLQFPLIFTYRGSGDILTVVGPMAIATRSIVPDPQLVGGLECQIS